MFGVAGSGTAAGIAAGTRTPQQQLSTAPAPQTVAPAVRDAAGPLAGLAAAMNLPPSLLAKLEGKHTIRGVAAILDGDVVVEDDAVALIDDLLTRHVEDVQAWVNSVALARSRVAVATARSAGTTASSIPVAEPRDYVLWYEETQPALLGPAAPRPTLTPPAPLAPLPSPPPPMHTTLQNQLTLAASAVAAAAALGDSLGPTATRAGPGTATARGGLAGARGHGAVGKAGHASGRPGGLIRKDAIGPRKATVTYSASGGRGNR